MFFIKLIILAYFIRVWSLVKKWKEIVEVFGWVKHHFETDIIETN